MNRLQLKEGDKQMVSFDNGAKAVLIFRGLYRKMQLDYYQPSADYFNHIKGKRLMVKNGQIVKERHNLSQFGTHLHLVNMHLSKLFKTRNPDADDSWLDDTEEQQLAKVEAWKRRRPMV